MFHFIELSCKDTNGNLTPLFLNVFAIASVERDPNTGKAVITYGTLGVHTKLVNETYEEVLNIINDEDEA